MNSLPVRTLETSEIMERLFNAYGPQHWWPAKTRFEVIVGAYLTQNTAWRNVELAINNLRRARMISPSAIHRAQLNTVEQLIRPSGYYRQKAANLKAFVQYLYANHSGSLTSLFKRATPTLRKELLSLPGVGPETADCILLYAANRPVFVVDVYARRLFFRHGLVRQDSTYLEIQSWVESQFAASPCKNTSDLTRKFNEFHALIVEVGKHHCRKEARCQYCPLQSCLPAKTPSREVREF